ncbi:MAG: methionyl-tRNA formyltransferase [Peptococcaceae bacterium]
MKIVFMGTPDFAVASLDSLYQAGHKIIGVVTQPDRPRGRGQKLTPSPVKTKALELNLDIFQPAKVKDPQFLELLKTLRPEVIVVVAYGQLLSPEILALPERGCINVHASLLPQYRGAAPIHWAVINGERETGVTTMLMDAGLDTGDMLLKASLSIGPNTTTGELHDRLAVLGGQLVAQTLAKLEKGELAPIPQQAALASYAPLIKKKHEIIDWNNKGETIHNQIRGMNPWPGAYTFLGDKRVKIRETLITAQDSWDSAAPPGTIIGIIDEGLLVQTGSMPITVKSLQPAGKNIMAARDFINGINVSPDQSFGDADD